MKRIWIINLAVILLFSSALFAQVEVPSATLAEARQSAKDVRAKLSNQSNFSTLPAKSVGPSVFSGRVTDLAVNPNDPSIFYVAYASGGLWKTESNGTRFTPLFDHESTMTIGAIAVDWDSGKIWVGTGEVNSSRSSYAGTGIYYSDDHGVSWNHSGLEETHHIGRIIIHPNNKDELYVAALGHLYSDNKERGIYKSTDGGASWTKSLYVDDKTGAVDLIMDPSDPDKLYAAMWYRKRFSWDFIESGASSGIYKTNNGGEGWNLVTGSSSNFPQGDGLGRIGLDMAITDDGVKLYALLDNYGRRPKKDKKKTSNEFKKDDFKTMTRTDFLKEDENKLDTYLRDNHFPIRYTAFKIKEMVKSNEIEVIDLANYLEDANRVLFDTPVIGAEVYVSNDEGNSWLKTHDDYINGLYNSYGYYFGQLRVNPSDPDELFIMGVPILRSTDGGKSWDNVNGKNVHADHHALWINDKRHGHLINGNDGGINISYDNGESWFKCNNPPVGQFYTINVDMADPYNIYGGTQDNGVWMGSVNYKASDRWHNTGQYPYKSLLGGDGMQVQIDKRDNTTVYTGYQFGHYFRINNRSRKRKYITPKPDLGASPYRWNWQSPILISDHNQDIVYMGSNKLLRSMDQGDHFVEISEDLTKGGIKGDVPYGTLTSIDESKFKFGLLYTGSDDGLIHRSDDGGTTWNQISETLPQSMWVSRVQASHHSKSRVYASLNGYRWDHFEAMAYISNDYGETWERLGMNLPSEPVNVIKEDPLNESFVYIGTDHGIYFSDDYGKTFEKICKDIPAVAVHDLVIHPREGDLVIGTHGRSVYVVDMKAIRTTYESKTSDKIQFLNDLSLSHSKQWGNRRNVYSEYNKAVIDLELFVPQSAIKSSYKLSLKSDSEKKIKDWEIELQKGYNLVSHDLSFSEKEIKYLNLKEDTQRENGKHYLPPGEYWFEINGVKQKLQIKEKE